MSDAPANGLGSARAYEAARLRWAGEADAGRLTALWQASRTADGRPREADDRETMRGWLEHGGAVLLEDDEGTPMCAVRWRWTEDGGWLVDRIATLEEARGRGFGRWLMTKLEALAIKRNVPTLTLELDQPDLLAYYQRLGYRPAPDPPQEHPSDEPSSSVTLVKRVGGTWQRQPGSAP